MAELNLNECISITLKNYLSDINEGRMVKKNFLEIQGTFLVKIRNTTFNGTIGENATEHIENFLEVVGPLKIRGVSHDRFRLSIFPIPLSGAASEWFKNEWDLGELWSDNGVPYQLCDHIFEPYRFKSGKAKWPTCSVDIDGFCNGGELLEMGAYVNAKLKNTYDPYLDINNIFGRNYEANNTSNTQDIQEHKEEHEGNEHVLSSKPTHDPSACQVRRFEMIKYSLDADDEKQDTSSSLGSNVDVDDADIKLVYDEEPMAEVPLIADTNVFATRQHYTEQPKFNNEGEVDQNAEQRHDTLPFLAK
nr:hypothetical protein [Tanacetum cinerariifolium]